MEALIHACAALVIAAPPPPVDAEVQPLSAEHRAIFWGSAPDPIPRQRHGLEPGDDKNHYLSSDERHLHFFRGQIKDLGGAYLGVGADPAYLFIGWQRPELAWLIDYDAWIVQVHHVYRQFFLAATTPEAFLAFWQDANTEAAERLLNSSFIPAEQQRRMTWVYRAGRQRTRSRFADLIQRYNDAGIPSFLNDLSTYRFVRGMIAADRVRPMSANLLDEHGLVGIGAASRQLGVPIRVVYLSNAEQYWRYPPQYRTNMESLLTNDTSVLLRTFAAQRSNGDYRYNTQPFRRYLAWLGASGIHKVYQIVDLPKITSRTEFPLTETTSWPGGAPPL
jgi:hypothetical protein